MFTNLKKCLNYILLCCLLLINNDSIQIMSRNTISFYLKYIYALKGKQVISMIFNYQSEIKRQMPYCLPNKWCEMLKLSKMFTSILVEWKCINLGLDSPIILSLNELSHKIGFKKNCYYCTWPFPKQARGEVKYMCTMSHELQPFEFILLLAIQNPISL